MRVKIAKYTLYAFLTLFSAALGNANPIENTSEKDSKIILLIDRARSLVNIATNHDTISLVLDEADSMAKMAMDTHLSIDILILRGLNEYYISNYEDAVGFYYQALDMAEQTADSSLLAKVNHNLGMVYDELEDYDEAISYFQKSLDMSIPLNDSALFAKTYQNLAISFQNKKEFSKALEYNEKANQLAIQQKDTIMLIDVTNNRGTIAYEQKNLQASMDYFLKALELYQKVDDQQGVAMAYNNIGLVYLDKKEYKKSLEFFKKSMALATDLKMYDFTADIYSNLTIYYKEIADYKNAYLFYDKYNTVYDSLVGEKKNKMIRQIQAKYQLAKNSRELDELKNKNQTQLDAISSAKTIQYFLIGIAILVILLMIATFYLLYKEKRLASELQNKTNELNELNLSKDKFFSIIAHDLKNPFNVLVSYTSLLKTDFEMFTKPELSQIISDLNQASENGFNLLQNLLLWTRSQTNRIHIFRTNFSLNVVFDQVKSHVELNLSAKNQQFIVDNNPELIIYADKDMIATVLRNLVFNAIKFSNKGAEIHLKTTVFETHVQIDVIDSGIGIAENVIHKLFAIDQNTSTEGTDGEPGTGLGLVICKEFIEKNDGTIWVESQLGKGSVFSFTLPLKSDKKA